MTQETRIYLLSRDTRTSVYISRAESGEWDVYEYPDTAQENLESFYETREEAISRGLTLLDAAHINRRDGDTCAI